MLYTIATWTCELQGTCEEKNLSRVPFVIHSPDKVPDLVMQSVAVEGLKTSDTLLFKADYAWSLWQEQQQRVFTFHAPDQVLARFETTDSWPRQSRLLYHPTLDPDTLFFDYPLGQLMCIEYLADHQGVLLHACAVIDRGVSVLFVGPPEVGKSTMARLWNPDAVVLSDDRVAVQMNATTPYAYGTPWHSSSPFVSPQGAPVKAVFFLKHGAQNHVRRLDTLETIQRLLPETHLPLWSSQHVEANLATVDQLIHAVPAWELAFVPSTDVIAYVREVLDAAV